MGDSMKHVGAITVGSASNINSVLEAREYSALKKTIAEELEEKKDVGAKRMGELVGDSVVSVGD